MRKDSCDEPFITKITSAESLEDCQFRQWLAALARESESKHLRLAKDPKQVAGARIGDTHDYQLLVFHPAARLEKPGELDERR